MNPAMAAVRRFSLIVSAAVLALPVAALAQPNLTAFSFTPTSINTSAGPANVTVNFSASDSSPISYFEMAFMDPSGVYMQRGFKQLAPATNVTDSVVVTFPRFSNAGTWQVVGIFLADTGGNTTFFDTTGAAGRGFPTTLQVSSTSDTISPALTAFSLAPATINTTAGSANVTANFTVTDDLAGANKVLVGLTSPSGNQTQNGSASFTPALSVTNSATLTFPQFSEAGTWTVSSVFVSDAAGNTTILDTDALTAAGFTTTLTVTSTTDSTSPSLTALSFTPTSVNTTSAPATVTFSFTATDDLSGVTSFQTDFISPSGAYSQSAASSFAATLSKTGTAAATLPKGSENGTWLVESVLLTDAAGNTRSLATADLSALGFPTQLTVSNTVGDTTPPVIVPTVNPLPNGNGWNNSAPVTVSWSVTDPESGITSSTGCGTSSVSAQTAGTTFTCSATNGAGLTSSASVTVMIDLTPPVITPVVSPTPNAPGWNNTDTTLSWNLSDSLSGIDTDSDTGCGAVTVTGETAGTTFTCSAANNAGLFTTTSVTVKIDATAPTATATAAPAPNAAGWNNSNVTVTFAGTDALSGIAGCTSPVTLSTEGTGQSASGVCTDVAGNVSAPASVSGIKIDKTAPTATATISPAPNAAGWNNSNVTVTFTGTDALSGVASCTSAVTITTETAGQTVSGTCTDAAGNVSATATVTVKIDKTGPTTTGVAAPAPNAAGWNNTNVVVTFTGADALSGIASCTSPVTLSSEGSGQSASGFCTDIAGNVGAPVTVGGIKIDKTVPVASNTHATPNPVEIGIPTTLTSTITDALSGVASAQYNLDGGTFAAMSGAFGGTSVNVSATVAAFATPGLHDLCVRGTDAAGNVSATDCIVLAVFDPNGGFATGGGGTTSPAGSDLNNPSGTGSVTFGFNVKYLPNATTPSGDVEFHYNAGNINFKSTGFDVLVVTTEPRAQVTGTGTINGSTVCKFSIDAWQGSFQPGNTDAFGMRIYNCGGGTGDRYNLATRPLTQGSIKIHQ